MFYEGPPPKCSVNLASEPLVVDLHHPIPIFCTNGCNVSIQKYIYIYFFGAHSLNFFPWSFITWLKLPKRYKSWWRGVKPLKNLKSYFGGTCAVDGFCYTETQLQSLASRKLSKYKLVTIWGNNSMHRDCLQPQQGHCWCISPGFLGTYYYLIFRELYAINVLNSEQSSKN